MGDEGSEYVSVKNYGAEDINCGQVHTSCRKMYSL